jgi:hypothetical protein
MRRKLEGEVYNVAKALLRVISVPLLLLLLGACATSPEPTSPDATEAPSQETIRETEDITRLRGEITRLRRELQAAREELAETEERLEEVRRDEGEIRRLRGENERLRNLVEELRLALIAAGGIEALPRDMPPQEPRTPRRRQPTPEESPGEGDADAGVPDEPEETDPRVPRLSAQAIAERYPFRRVTAVNPTLRSRTPAHLAAQGVERIPIEAGGYRYVDGGSNESTGEGIYLELTLLPGMEVPETAFKAKTVYPGEAERLLVERVTFSLAGQSFELEPTRVERLRDRTLAAEVAIFALHEDVRRLLTLTQRRAGAELTVTFHGVQGARTHEVTRRERLALANMIYTFREMGGEL